MYRPLFAFLVLLTICPLSAARAAEIPPPAASDRLDDAQALAVLDFWTEQRLQQAWNLDAFPGQPVAPVIGVGADGSGYTPAVSPYQQHSDTRVVGTLVYRQPGVGEGLSHCTAAVIAAGSESLVVTAAHCVSGRGQWFDQLMFIPAFQADPADAQAARAPLGRWPVQQVFIPRLGADSSADDDIAVARVMVHTPATLPALCTAPRCTLQSVVGDAFEAQVSLHELPALVAVLGYPASDQQGAPYPFASLRYCIGRAEQDELSAALRLSGCATQVGNSGGPVIALDPRAEGARRVWAVVHDTAVHARLRAATFGPVFEMADSAW